LTVPRRSRRQVLRALAASRVRGSNALAAPQDVRDFLGGLEHEVFAVLHLDAGKRVNDYVELYCGNLTQTSVDLSLSRPRYSKSSRVL
jgi:DNA repair protein RadC